MVMKTIQKYSCLVFFGRVILCADLFFPCHKTNPKLIVNFKTSDFFFSLPYISFSKLTGKTANRQRNIPAHLEGIF